MNRPKYKELYEREKSIVRGLKRDLYGFLDSLNEMGIKVNYYFEMPENEFEYYFSIKVENNGKYLYYRFVDEYKIFKDCLIDRIWREKLKEGIDLTTYLTDEEAKIIKVEMPTINISEGKDND